MVIDAQAKTTTIPDAWESNSKIGVISTSSPTMATQKHRAERAIHLIEKELLGTCIVPDATSSVIRYRAGEPSRIARQIEEMFADPEVRLIIASVGGYNTNSILSEIDWGILRKNPTHISGYSDFTALLLSVWQKCGQPTAYGPSLLPQWGDPIGPFPETISSLMALISNQHEYVLPPTSYYVSPSTDWFCSESSFRKKPKNPGGSYSLVDGEACGVLVGGNIETINTLIGTPYLPSFSNAVFFFEAKGSEAHLPRLHRSLTHLRDAGCFDELSAVLVGKMLDATPYMETTLRDLLREVLSPFKIPIVMDLPIGHVEPQLTIPIGYQASVVANTSGCQVRWYLAPKK